MVIEKVPLRGPRSGRRSHTADDQEADLLLTCWGGTAHGLWGRRKLPQHTSHWCLAIVSMPPPACGVISCSFGLDTLPIAQGVSSFRQRKEEPTHKARSLRAMINAMRQSHARHASSSREVQRHSNRTEQVVWESVAMQ